MLIKPRRKRLITRRSVLIGGIAAPFVLRRRSEAAFVSFGVSSGVSCGIATPAPAVAAGLTCKYFEGFDSLAGIDLNNTGASGFNFYTQCNFAGYGNVSAQTSSGNQLTFSTMPTPFGISVGAQIYDPVNGRIPQPTYATAVSGSGPFTVTLSNSVTGVIANGALIGAFLAPQPAAKLSVSNSVLTMANVGQGSSNYGMGTIYITSAGPGLTLNYNGYVAPGDWYSEIKWAFDESLGNGSGGLTNKRWPALSAYSWPGTLFGQATDEWDIPDLLPGVGNVALDFFMHAGGTVHGPADQDTYTNQGRGQVNTLGSLTGGSGYVNGTYNAVPLTGSGVAAGVTANITVAGGAVTAVTIVAPGIRVVASESLTCANTSLGGTGSGWHVTVASITNYVFQASVFNTIGAYYKRAGASGVGQLTFYFNGIVMGTVTFSQGGPASPAISNNYNGVFTEAEQFGSGFTFVVANGCQGNFGGGDWPLLIDYFGVWGS